MGRPARVTRAALLLAVATAACSDELPPLGEALIVVDTDLPVPRLAARLRLDLYSADGSRWYESRDVALHDPRDWPASFSLLNPEEEGARDALVRVRVYPSGKERDYRGERYSPRPVGGDPAAPWVIPEPAADEGPRLVRDGVDVTPPTEPAPLLTVDRLLRVRLELGQRGLATITMRGACIGTMADLASQQSCVDTEGLLAPVTEPELDDDLAIPAGSQDGLFGAEEPCTVAPRPAGLASDGAPLYDEEMCVPGGVFLFGNADGLELVGTPPIERAAVMPPIVLDRFEVTVARWRQAVAGGFASPDETPVANEGALSATATAPGSCSWSTAPRGRETHPINCVTWQAARAFCQFLGGDLPSEAAWEHAAQAAGRESEARYPWGTDEPSCERAVYARVPDGPSMSGVCAATGAGLQAVDAAAQPGQDATPTLGLVHFAGNVLELTRDAHHDLDSACVVGAPLAGAACIDDASAVRVGRGGHWAGNSLSLYLGTRWVVGVGTQYVQAGFRCARAGAP